MAKRIGSRNGNPALGGLVQQPALFGPIGYIPPAEAEANYYAARETLDMVA
jgi:hypothetical protein